MSFVPKVILGDKAINEKPEAPRHSHNDMIDINRLSQVFFRIRCNDLRQRVIVFLEEVADAQHSENLY